MHFTYTARADPYSLQQGDLLKLTPELDALLVQGFPTFHSNAVNRYFLVLTQSCDLVLRGGRCKSGYLTIAAVQSLDDVIDAEIARFQRDPVERTLQVCNQKYYGELVDLMERILNNNDPRYFYLRRDAFAGLESDHCALLQLSIPIRADEHYQTLLAAKVAQLSESFQHKLGYLVGHMFGRIGTEDWVPDHVTPEAFEKLKAEPLEAAAAWIPSDVHTKLLKRIKALPADQQTPEQVEVIVEDLTQQREGRLAQVLEEISSVLTDLGVPAATVERARQHLKNRASFAAQIKK